MVWMILALGVAVAVVAVAARLAPVDEARWHPVEISPREVGNYPGRGRFLAVRDGDREAFAALAAQVVDTPRTRILAGDVAEGQVTFETRSPVFGFPDYTTITWAEGRIQSLGRLRFGLEDMGVNRRRILGWLRAAGLD